MRKVEQADEQAEIYPVKPRITVTSLTFSDKTKVEFKSDDIVVFVGPNNAGKTAALREVRDQSTNVKSRTVTKDATIEVKGSEKDLINLLDEQAQLINTHGIDTYAGYRFDIQKSFTRYIDRSDRDVLQDVFAFMMSTENRLKSSDPVESIFYPNDRPTNPIHILVTDPDLEKRVSDVFRGAFGVDLLVFRAGGKIVPLLVGNREDVEGKIDSFQKDDIEFVLSKMRHLHKQGDGMRAFASIILDIVATKVQSLLLIDEPETFLHPPQARMIGEHIGRFAGQDRQIFVATHSPDVLQGLLAVREMPIRIIRIHRSGSENIVKELSPKLARDISSNILTRSSGVYQGIFRSGVVVCESDADALFYEALLDSVAPKFGTRADILFVHGAGKQRIAKLAETSRSLGVPTAAIVDIDVLNDQALFKELCRSFDVKWADVSSDWNTVRSAVENQKIGLSLDQIVAALRKMIDDFSAKAMDLKTLGQGVRDLLGKSAPWDAVKRAGRMALPGGDVVAAFDRLAELCAKSGLWILEVGEVEGFCKSINHKGPAWVESVLATKKLENEPELALARELLVDVRSYLGGAPPRAFEEGAA